MKQTSLGALICSLRKQNGMTQAALAEKLGVTDKAVSKWERDRSFPDISLFPKLADQLGVTVDDLLSKCSQEGFSSRLLQIMRMSHDVRTPLNIILGCARMAERNYQDQDSLLRYLKNIRISGEYLLRVFNNMLEVTSAEDGRVTSDIPPEILSSQHNGEGYDFSGKRILLVEDIEINREITTELLKQTGAEVECAEDGNICLEKVDRAPGGYYDLILMDIKMPNMDGIEATRRIRGIEDKEKAAVPIVAITANVYEEDRKKAFAAGMDDFAEKPIIARQLLDSIEKYL